MKVHKQGRRNRSPATIRVYNCSKQLLSLQLRAPGADFYAGEKQVRLTPGQDAMLPRTHVLLEQVRNLEGRRMLKVLHDSEQDE